MNNQERFTVGQWLAALIVVALSTMVTTGIVFALVLILS